MTILILSPFESLLWKPKPRLDHRYSMPNLVKKYRKLIKEWCNKASIQMFAQSFTCQYLQMFRQATFSLWWYYLRQIFCLLWKLAITIFVQIALQQYLISELNVSNQHFPSSSFNWNQLGTNIQNYASLEIFKRELLIFIRPKPAGVYKIHHPKGLKLLTRLRLGISHLCEHKFRHNFNDTIDQFCLCGTNSLEPSEHFFLHCTTYAYLHLKLFDNLYHWISL